MSHGKRGKTLENIIEYSNKVYKNKGMALVDKVPTPWNVHYNKKTGRVVRAFPEKKGTVDFVGISHGRSIAFDAKSTKIRTSFPLKNVEQHQVDYLINHQDQGGISFFIVYFEKHNEAYYLPIDELKKWWDSQLSGGRKSIPYEWFVLNTDLIKTNNGVPLDYLERAI
ncbi:Holliday junction resolvase RecU [Oceanobacillus alkalisoli]|uniref:Holliday junction resolvase RecU n=1 Tax=Oceanobacillus alkalisoli TaxID=2925113 RepID=UPI001EE43EAF|nr:Holliday junction resolvase RecU [Oceanobacillus alkalisoli]MCG5104432.1 Holliday junction resolvase RecU [Oceanobacillus alkalisoli]